MLEEEGKPYRCYSGDLQQRWGDYTLHAEQDIDNLRL